MNKIFLITVCITGFFAFSLPAQEVGKDETNILYRNEASGGPIFHSQGWGLTFKRGVNITGYKKRIVEVEYVGMKHPKEVKSVNPDFENAKTYIYGKTNAFSILRTGIGRQKVIAGKDGRNGVEVRYTYTGGASLGFAKPVYLDIVMPTNEPYEFYVKTERYDPDEHYPGTPGIYGRASFLKGIGEIKLYPGIYTKMGLNFEYGTLHEDIKVLEAGIGFDFYLDEVPIMAPQYADNNQYFFTFYVSLLYGGKW